MPSLTDTLVRRPIPHRSAGAGAAHVRRIAAIGQTVNAAEALYKSDLYSANGILRGQTTTTQASLARRSPRLARILDHPRAATVLNATNLACGVTAFAFAHKRGVRAATSVVSAVAGSLSSQRNPYGRDGSDQMQHVIHLYDAAATLIVDRERADDVFLRAVNAQLAVSYAASGLIKLVSDDWRSGRAFAGVMRTQMYGSPAVTRLLDRHPVLGKLVCWQTIIWETSFPLVYLLPAPIARIGLDFAKLFHISIGQSMGLPRFIWAFHATHPAAEYVLSRRRGSNPGGGGGITLLATHNHGAAA